MPPSVRPRPPSKVGTLGRGSDAFAPHDIGFVANPSPGGPRIELQTSFRTHRTTSSVGSRGFA